MSKALARRGFKFRRAEPIVYAFMQATAWQPDQWWLPSTLALEAWGQLIDESDPARCASGHIQSFRAGSDASAAGR